MTARPPRSRWTAPRCGSTAASPAAGGSARPVLIVDKSPWLDVLRDADKRGALKVAISGDADYRNRFTQIDLLAGATRDGPRYLELGPKRGGRRPGRSSSLSVSALPCIATSSAASPRLPSPTSHCCSTMTRASGSRGPAAAAGTQDRSISDPRLPIPDPAGQGYEPIE